jgi:hypothetical protein
MKKALFLALIALMPFEMVCKRDSEITTEQIEIRKAQATVKRLMPNFKYENDSKTLQYKHVTFDSFVHTEKPSACIKSIIFNYTLYCKIEFNATNLLSITEITIKIDDEIMTVPGFSSQYDSVEILSINDDSIYKVLRFIATNPGKKIKVRLDGKNEHYNFTLDKMHHKAICETVSLYDALELLIKTATDPSKM